MVQLIELYDYEEIQAMELETMTFNAFMLTVLSRCLSMTDNLFINVMTSLHDDDIGTV
jgi:hypothetical protein